MPTGGLAIYGSGLRLQAVSPGVLDLGNANINGNMIAKQFTTAPLGTGIGSANELFGHALTQGGGNQQVLVGNTIVTGTQNQAAAVGKACSAYVGSSMAYGMNCQAGFSGDLTANKVAVGVSAAAGIANPSAAQAVAMGYLVNANGSSNVALGSDVTANTTNTTPAETVAVGRTININHASITDTVALGRGIAITTALTNNLVVGSWGSAVIWPGMTTSNTIWIGNTLQTTIRIGAYTFTGAGVGDVQKIADAAYTVLATDGTVIYTSITAARIVTLPAANAVQAGYKVLVSDSSGSASGVNTITLTRAGADTINGGTTAAIILPYGCREVMSDGVSKWTVTRSI
jgi:hypothetical protein